MRLKRNSLAGLFLAVVAFSGSANDEALSFLKGIEEFKDINLTITEPKLQSEITSQGLYSTRFIEDSKVSYHLLTTSGENLIVMFDGMGKCTGIQRMRPTPKSLIEERVGKEAYRKWMRDLRKMRSAKEDAEALKADKEPGTKE